MAAGTLACLLMLASLPPATADQPVGITESLPWVEVQHRGRTVRIERNQDNTNMVDLEYAVTSWSYDRATLRALEWVNPVIH